VAELDRQSIEPQTIHALLPAVDADVRPVQQARNVTGDPSLLRGS
jgi:hypothetical protein